MESLLSLWPLIAHRWKVRYKMTSIEALSHRRLLKICCDVYFINTCGICWACFFRSSHACSQILWGEFSSAPKCFKKGHIFHSLTFFKFLNPWIEKALLLGCLLRLLKRKQGRQEKTSTYGEYSSHEGNKLYHEDWNC